MLGQSDTHQAIETIPTEQISEVSNDLRVTFNPPLWLQRRTWVLEVLREVDATSVLDLGCGEGSLLEVLCEPASTVSSYQPSNVKERTIDIHVSHIAGLDVSAEDLQYAVETTRPLSEEETKNLREWDKPRPRWEDMRVDIWKGGLEVLNQDEVGWFGRKEWDAIVSTEVVEHLPEEILDVFFPTVLGVYQPPILLLTTPNYNFNQLFTPPVPPGHRPLRASGYPDPTGKTDRVFRHHDHKREWREEEWKVWCEEGGNEWGYDVEVGGVGNMQEKDPWNREELAGKASMTAIFRRKPGKEVERTKKAMKVVKRGGMKHELMATHYHKSHEMAGKPLSPDMIMDAIRRVMEAGGDLDYLKGDAAVEDVWQQQEVAIACGGNLSLLLRLLEDLSGKGEWELVKELPGEVHVWREKKWYWRIIWKAFVEKAPEEETDNQGEEAWQPNHGWIENEATDEDEDPWPTTYSSWESSEDNTLADGGGWDIKESRGWENELSWTVDESGDWKIS